MGRDTRAEESRTPQGGTHIYCKYRYTHTRVYMHVHTHACAHTSKPHTHDHIEIYCVEQTCLWHRDYENMLALFMTCLCAPWCQMVTKVRRGQQLGQCRSGQCGFPSNKLPNNMTYYLTAIHTRKPNSFAPRHRDGSRCVRMYTARNPRISGSWRQSTHWLTHVRTQLTSCLPSISGKWGLQLSVGLRRPEGRVMELTVCSHCCRNVSPWIAVSPSLLLRLLFSKFNYHLTLFVPPRSLCCVWERVCVCVCVCVYICLSVCVCVHVVSHRLCTHILHQHTGNNLSMTL